MGTQQTVVGILQQVKRIPLSPICCHRKGNIDQKFTLTKLQEIVGSGRRN